MVWFDIRGTHCDMTVGFNIVLFSFAICVILLFYCNGKWNAEVMFEKKINFDTNYM